MKATWYELTLLERTCKCFSYVDEWLTAWIFSIPQEKSVTIRWKIHVGLTSPTFLEHTCAGPLPILVLRYKGTSFEEQQSWHGGKSQDRILQHGLWSYLQYVGRGCTVMSLNTTKVTSEGIPENIFGYASEELSKVKLRWPTDWDGKVRENTWISWFVTLIFSTMANGSSILNDLHLTQKQCTMLSSTGTSDTEVAEAEYSPSRKRMWACSDKL